MKRYTGQKALYEAISRTKAKSQRRSILERLLPNDNKVEKAEKMEPPVVPVVEEPKPQVVEEPVKATKPLMARSAAEKPPMVSRPPMPAAKPVVPVEAPESPRPVQTWLRPKAVQLHDGRIEVSLPYTIGVTVVLAAVVLVLAAFRLGQEWSAVPAATTPLTPTPTKSPQPSVPPVMREAPTPRVESTRPEVSPGAANPDATPAPATQGDNWIILAQYPREADLQPVVKHFADYGIELLIVPFQAARDLFAQYRLDASRLPSGDGYLLVTAGTYENPNREGSNGYQMKQEITRVGALYKGRAPTGCYAFGPTYFSDAYGIKIR